VTNRKFFLVRREAELPAFLSVLTALPEGKRDYTPHDRSPSAAQIVWMIADFKRHDADLTDAVAKLDDEAWQRPAQFAVGGKVVIEQPLGDLVWFFFFDAIHHRGQLSTYIRPMGGKVPSIYGPSADSTGGG
jgi:uncharacterized damage-inducible protein DinB